jgi:hypothetical protein
MGFFINIAAKSMHAGTGVTIEFPQARVVLG